VRHWLLDGSLTLEDGTDKFFLTVGNKLPIAAQLPEIALKVSIFHFIYCFSKDT